MKIADVYLDGKKIMEMPLAAEQDHPDEQGVYFCNFKKVWHAKVNPNSASKLIDRAKVVFTLENGEEVTLNEVQIHYDNTVDEIEFWYAYEKLKE